MRFLIFSLLILFNYQVFSKDDLKKTNIEKKIYTIPEFVKKRYSNNLKTILAVFWISLFVFVNLTSVMYLGGKAMDTIFGNGDGSLITTSIIGLGLFALTYSVWGGLSAVAWTDVVQVVILIFGGILMTGIALTYVTPGGGIIEGLSHVYNTVPERFSMILSKGEIITPDGRDAYFDLPGIAVLIGGMWIANTYYWGFNQYIIQRTFAAKNLGEAQKQKFIAGYKFNVQDSLYKDLSKADNRPLTYIMIGIFAFFSFVYVYVEKIKKPTAAKMANMFKRLQLISSAAFSLGHGGSDAQKVMGIIGAALIANGNIVEFKELPNWVPLACYSAIVLGTLSGGWKIVKTMGTRITKVTPLEGVGAETAGAITLFMTAQMGIPVSTTHTITGAIIGVGATKRLSAVRWGVTRNLLFAWIVTIPISAIVAGLMYLIISAL
mgnify:CR=1 FL=1